MTLLEGHGTSTRAGDVAEMETAMRLLAEGHAGQARIDIRLHQVADRSPQERGRRRRLLKAILACYHKILPPSGST